MGNQEILSNGFLAATGIDANVQVTNKERFVNTLITATIGGTISAVSGGKFVNGAITAAIAYNYNQAGKRDVDSGGNVFLAPGEDPSVLTPNVLAERIELLREAIAEYRDRIRVLSSDAFAEHMGTVSYSEIDGLFFDQARLDTVSNLNVLLVKLDASTVQKFVDDAVKDGIFKVGTVALTSGASVATKAGVDRGMDMIGDALDFRLDQPTPRFWCTDTASCHVIWE